MQHVGCVLCVFAKRVRAGAVSVAVAKVSFSIRISVHGSIGIGGEVLSLLVTRYNKTHIHTKTSEREQKEREPKRG